MAAKLQGKINLLIKVKKNLSFLIHNEPTLRIRREIK